MKPIKTNIRKWIKALKSGDYEQGKKQLYKASSDKYCCLGVACKLYAKEKKVNFKELIKIHQVLPGKVQDWLGLEYCNPSMLKHFEGLSLTVMNDSGKYNFRDIADCIEKEYLQ
jgi:hypothetical protein